MSWSPELFIGGMRPWPDAVHVVRSQTDEMRRYVPEGENERLRELVREMFKGLRCPTNATNEGCPPCRFYDREECECSIDLRMRELGIEVGL